MASVIPLGKGKLKKNEISNYRPVLNTFSKFYEKVIKKQLVRFMGVFFTFDVCLYLRLRLKEWRKKLDDNFVVGTVLTDLSKAFDCIPHDL